MPNFDLIFESVEDRMTQEEALREMLRYWKVLRGVPLQELLNPDAIEALKKHFPTYLHDILFQLSIDELEGREESKRRSIQIQVDYAKMADRLIEYLLSQEDNKALAHEVKNHLADLIGEKKLTVTQWRHITDQFPVHRADHYYELEFRGQARSSTVILKRKEKSTGELGPMVRPKS